MEAVIGRCVVLKNLPPESSEVDVRRFLDDVGHATAYTEIDRYPVDDRDVRWVVLFDSEEDAKLCLDDKSYRWRYHGIETKVTTDLCSECIVPDHWLQDVGDVTKNTEDEWEVLQSSLLDDDPVVIASDVRMGVQETEQFASYDTDDLFASMQKVYINPLDPAEVKPNEDIPAAEEEKDHYTTSFSSSSLFRSGRESSLSKAESPESEEKAGSSKEQIMEENVDKSDDNGNAFIKVGERKHESDMTNAEESMPSDDMFGSSDTQSHEKPKSLTESIRSADLFSAGDDEKIVSKAESSETNENKDEFSEQQFVEENIDKSDSDNEFITVGERKNEGEMIELKASVPSDETFGAANAQSKDKPKSLTESIRSADLFSAGDDTNMETAMNVHETKDVMKNAEMDTSLSECHKKGANASTDATVPSTAEGVPEYPGHYVHPLYNVHFNPASYNTTDPHNLKTTELNQTKLNAEKARVETDKKDFYDYPPSPTKDVSSPISEPKVPIPKSGDVKEKEYSKLTPVVPEYEDDEEHIYDEIEMASSVTKPTVHDLVSSPTAKKEPPTLPIPRKKLRIFEETDELTPPPNAFIVVSGIDQNVSVEDIELFFENKKRSGGGDIQKIEFKDGKVIIEFKSFEDIERARKICLERACDGEFWDVFDVEESRAVLVSGYGEKSEEGLLYYFENKRRSQGGDVTSVEKHSQNDAYIVTFKKREDAERVCKPAFAHKLDGCDLEVSLYYPCIDLEKSSVITLPPPYSVTDLDNYVMRFLRRSKEYKSELEQRLKTIDAELNWVSDETEGDTLLIKCVIDVKDKDARKKISDWQDNSTSCVNWFRENIIANTRPIACEIWQIANRAFHGLTVNRPEAVALFPDKQASSVVIVGEKNEVLKLEAQIRNVIAKLEDELEMSNETVTKVIKLRHFEMTMMRALRIDKKPNIPDLEIQIDGAEREVVLKGFRKDVDAAFERITSIIKGLKKKKVEGYTKLSFDMLFAKETRDFIKKQFSRQKLIGAVDEKVSNGFRVRGKKDGCRAVITKVRELIDSVTEKDLKIEIPGFDTFVESTSDPDPDRPRTESRIEIKVGTLVSQTADVLVNSTNKYLDMRVGRVSRQLLAAAGQDVQDECAKNYTEGISYGQVAVTTAGQLRTCKVIFHGMLPSWDGGSGQSVAILHKFVSKCLEDADKIKARSIAFPALGTGPALGYPIEAFNSEHQAHSSGFRRGSVRASKHIPQHDETIYERGRGRSAMTVGNVALEIVQEDITRQTTGAIVNSTLEKLNLSLGLVSKAILEAAGAGIQLECLQAGGKGQGVDVMAKCFYESLKQYVEKGYTKGCLKTMRIVLYDTAMVEQFTSTIQAQTSKKPLSKEAIKQVEKRMTTLERGILLETAKTTIKLPNNWKMKLSDRPHVEILRPSDSDFATVALAFTTQTGKPSYNIIRIERIQNPALYMQYCGKKSELEASKSSGIIERWLWHGTRDGSVCKNINEKGFDRNYNTGASLGQGVYFAVDGGTSMSYCGQDEMGFRRMYYAKVLTGDYAQSHGAIRTPPNKGDPNNPHKTYDSVVDNTANPGVFVIFHDAQAYPTFLVTFR
ncbi:PAR15-like protein [Mya arenaria]|uniref:Poly [ADP-ribose] polymerase n=1 Tax=Mya arenaria TaxID=6604 RepID=A0ABY7FJH5_MYAAR|nr:PAR15-like protein [Mya arenaria]